MGQIKVAYCCSEVQVACSEWLPFRYHMTGLHDCLPFVSHVRTVWMADLGSSSKECYLCTTRSPTPTTAIPIEIQEIQCG